MPLNREWHRLYRVPPGAREQRAHGHAAYAHVCGCRDVPDRIKSDVEKRLKQ